LPEVAGGAAAKLLTTPLVKEVHDTVLTQA